MLTYRDVKVTDAAEVARIANLCRDFFPTAVEDAEKSLARERATEKFEQWTVERDGLVFALVGYSFHPFFGFILFVNADPKTVSQSEAKQLLSYAFEAAPKTGKSIGIEVSSRFPELAKAALALNFKVMSNEICQRFYLQETAVEEYDGVRAPMRFVSLNEVLNNETLKRSLYKLDCEAAQDTPNFTQGIFPPYEGFEKMLLSREPRSSIICYEHEIAIAFSFLTARSGGVMISSGTGVARAYRGQKLALKAKLMGLRIAKELGFKMVCTANDEVNVAMRHINEKVGFKEFGRETMYLYSK